VYVTTGVSQGCTLSLTLFLLVLDSVMNKTVKGRQEYSGKWWKG